MTADSPRIMYDAPSRLITIGKCNIRELKNALQCYNLIEFKEKGALFSHSLTCCCRSRTPSTKLFKLYNSFNLKFHAEPYSIVLGLNDENETIFLFENSVVLHFVIQRNEFPHQTLGKI